MPTYEYHCKACEKEYEQFQKITDEPLTTCPSCGKEALRRGPGGGIGLSFKGSGFYITDYKNAPEKSSCPCGEKPAESCGNN